MKLIAQQAFSWAHRGVDVREYKEGEEIETDDQDLIGVSTQEGWTSPADGAGTMTAPAKPARRQKAQ